MTEEEEFEFRLRFEQEQAAPEPQEYTGLSAKFPEIAKKVEGFYKGAKDPIDALAQILSESVPENVRGDVNALQNWIADKTGLMEKLPEGGLSEQLRQQEAQYQAGRKAEGDTGFDWDRMAGTMTTAAIPGLGAAKLSAPATLAWKMATGAGLGAGYSQLAPVYGEGDFFKEKGKQAAIGGTIGAVIPPAISLFKGTGKIIDDVTRPMHFRNTGWMAKLANTELGKKLGMTPGIVKDTRDYLQDITEGSQEKVIQALSKAKQGQTSAQALASQSGPVVGSKLIKLEQEIAKRAPSDPAQSLFRGQEQARKKLIGAIAGTDDDLAKAIQTRTLTSAKNYGESYKQMISGDKELLALAKNPYVSKAIPTASDLAKANGIDPKTNLTEYLHYVKIGIDKQLAKTGDDALAGAERTAASKAQSKLIDWIKKKNPAYDAARQRHAEMSTPINQMEVGRELQKGLTSSVERESAAPFMGAIREAPRTLKKATGFRHDKLEDVLSPEQMKSVRKVSEELLTAQRIKDISAKTKSPYGALQEEAKLQIAPMLERNVMIANALLRRLGRRATPEYEKVAWEIMRDPKYLSRILKKPDTNQTKKLIMDLLAQESIAVPSITTAREVQ